MEFELTPRDTDVNVTVSEQRLVEELGNQGILGDDVSEREFIYLATLALECRTDGRYSVEDVIMEFIRNTSSVDVSYSEANQIEELL